MLSRIRALVFMLSTSTNERVISLNYRSPKLARRALLIAAAPTLITSRVAAVAPDARLSPTDFDLLAEPRTPYIHYLDNADKLCDHLLWFADGVDGNVAAALDAEITAFAATYPPRSEAPPDAGPTPGLSELKTAYDALAYHLARYRGRDTVEPLPEALAVTLRSNAIAAQKRIRKVQTAQEAARGAWPTCRGVPLGTRDSQCST